MVKDNGDGTYDATFTVLCAGPYTVHVMAKAPDADFAHVDNSPYHDVMWLPSEICPSKCSIEGDGILGSCVKEEATFTVLARDIHDNLVVNCANEFSVTMTGPQRIKPKVTNHGDGTFTCSYSCSITGAYVTSVLVSGQHIRGSQFNTSIVSGYFNADEARAMQTTMGVTDVVDQRASFAGGSRARRIQMP